MSTQRRASLYIMNITDILVLIASFFLSFGIRVIFPVELHRDARLSVYTPLLLGILVSYLLVDFLVLYREDYLKRTAGQEFLASLRMVALVMVLDIMILFFTKTSEHYSRIYMVIYPIVSLFMVFGVRQAVKSLYLPRYRNSRFAEKIVLIAAEQNIAGMIENVNRTGDWRLHIVGIILTDKEKKGEYIRNIPVISTLEHAFDDIRMQEVDSVYLMPDENIDAKKWVEQFQKMGKTVHLHVAEFYVNSSRRVQEMLGDSAVVSYLPDFSEKGRVFLIKRALDVILSLACMPFYLLVTIFVVLGDLKSRGPVLLARVRVGKNGRRFHQYRYRILRVDAKERISAGKSPYTGMGRFLKASHLDGLPQIVNILVGDMSFVGPKAPSLGYFIDHPKIMRCLCMKPGLTGAWCVKPGEDYGEESYLNHWSLGQDAGLFFLTIGRYLTFRSLRAYPDYLTGEELRLLEDYLEYRQPMEYDRSAWQQKKSASRSMYLGVKRGLDIAGSLLGIIVLSPLLAALSIAVMADDGGNPIYGHRRIGRNGKRITVYKFRSMKRNAGDLGRILSPEQMEQYRREFKIDDDPRITRVGGFIRRTSLDELPQLFNILGGSMSIVGPRPVTEREVRIYGQDAAKLLSVKPGLTGYWQAYARNDATYASGERQRMEMYYIDHQSFGLDVKILLHTVKSVAKQEGAQ